MREKLKQLVRVLAFGSINFIIGRYFIEVLWPHASFKRGKGATCFGIWAKTVIVYRADCWHAYKWAVAVILLGFGFGLGRRPDSSSVGGVGDGRGTPRRQGEN